MNLEKHTQEIARLRMEADKLPDDNPAALMEKICLLALCMSYVGRLSSHLDGYYKKVYALRKQEWARARIAATKDKEAHAELAVVELRQEEAQAYEDMQRWRNALESLTEEIHSLKLKMRINFNDGTVGERYAPGAKTKS